MPKLEPIPSLSGRTGSRRARSVRVSSSLAEINVVPLVDVMLVLLVIFMVAAPMMQQGFPVNLATSRRAPAIDRQPVVVSIPSTYRQDGKVRLGNEAVALTVLDERVRQALSGQLKHDVTLAIDGAVTYQDIARVMDQLKTGGVENVHMQTQPLAGGPPR
jgi:biopolymer transport protein TolR